MARNIAFDLANDFTGGLNLRADQFQLAPNESPEIINMEIDPRGGAFTRAGWQMLNTTAIGAAVWNPKTLFNYKHSTAPTIMFSTGKSGATNGEVYKSTGGNFTRLNISVANINVTNTDGASFTQWENDLYFVTGSGTAQAYKWTSGNTYATVLAVSGPTWQAYELPVGGYFPRANICLTHANKMFVANTYENGVAQPNRLRWSHEGSPENWYDDDYIDITAGGEGIRGIHIIDGQLLIFKPKATYLLMGYDADNFQLVELSTIVGIDYPQQACAGDGGVYFFDYPKGLFFYDRNGIQNIFLRLNPIIAENKVNDAYLDLITCSFINDRLWLSMPYQTDDLASLPTTATVNFVFDQSIGKFGAYTMFRSSDSLGLVNGCDWRSSNDAAYHLMCRPDDAFVMFVDDFAYTQDEEYISSTIVDKSFANKYVTSWFYDDRYVQDKTFVGPNFVMKEVDLDTNVQVEVYYNFNNKLKTRTQTIALRPRLSGGTYSTDGSGGVYGTAVYGENTEGASVYKARRLGRAKSIQLHFVGKPTALYTGEKWGINSIAYKYKRRNIKG